MKAFLLFINHDFDLLQKLPWNEQTLTQDLELNTLFNTMANSDEFLFDVVKKVMFSGLNNELHTVLYRQNILKDCLNNSSTIRTIYTLAVEAVNSRKKHWYGGFSKYPSSILYESIEMLRDFVSILKQLKNIAHEHANQFESQGFIRLLSMLKNELDDEYFDKIENHLRELKFHDGILISAELGKYNRGTHYVLRKLQGQNKRWIQRLFAKKPQGYTFYIASNDESGATALSQLKDEGINLVANALAQSTDHIISFFNMLRTELAFYVGCLNLHEQLVQIGEPSSFPYPKTHDECCHSFKGLYDVCLALNMKQKIVGNDMSAENKDLVIISGANQGGKSTFLRSIGLSQLMMQCGLFVPAELFSANMCDSLYTHYKREEDSTMRSGKFDEELSRMSDIADHITSNSMVLFNESFAATNEREGSEIARQIVSALLEHHIKVFFVTHLYEFAHDFYNKKMKNAMYLRAERESDGTRTFKLIEGEPLQTSYGVDLYHRIFNSP